MNAVWSALVLSVTIPASSTAAAEVWEVGGGGLATIGEAVALASDGDIVLVHSGSYPGFAIDGKSLVITAEAGANVYVFDAVLVQGLGATQTVALQGIILTLRANDNAGGLWIESCILRGDSGEAGLEALACSSVVVRRSSVEGGDGIDGSEEPGSEGLRLRDTTAAVFSCSIAGGMGAFGDYSIFPRCSKKAGGPGGDGILIEDSVLLLQDTSVEGGMGGWGSLCSTPHCGPGGDGGVGIVTLGSVEITLVQATVQGGLAGVGGGPVCSDGQDGQAWEFAGGTILTVPEEPRALEAISPLREGQLATVLASGEPSELLAVYASHATAIVDLPSLYGSLLLGPPPLLVGAGVLPASGQLQLQALVPDLGASVEGLALRLQAVSLPLSGGFVLGEPATLVLLDAGI